MKTKFEQIRAAVMMQHQLTPDEYYTLQLGDFQLRLQYSDTFQEVYGCYYYNDRRITCEALVNQFDYEEFMYMFSHFTDSDNALNSQCLEDAILSDTVQLQSRINTPEEMVPVEVPTTNGIIDAYPKDKEVKTASQFRV